jgi:hypothetical protein
MAGFQKPTTRAKPDTIRSARSMTPNSIYAWTWIAAWAVAALILIVA